MFYETQNLFFTLRLRGYSEKKSIKIVDIFFNYFYQFLAKNFEKRNFVVPNSKKTGKVFLHKVFSFADIIRLLLAIFDQILTSPESY